MPGAVALEGGRRQIRVGLAVPGLAAHRQGPTPHHRLRWQAGLQWRRVRWERPTLTPLVLDRQTQQQLETTVFWGVPAALAGHLPIQRLLLAEARIFQPQVAVAAALSPLHLQWLVLVASEAIAVLV